MSARIGVGDAVETRVDGLQWIVLGRWRSVVRLERPGETLSISVRGIRRIGRQLPLLTNHPADSAADDDDAGRAG